jgi:hypothetical protein
MPPPIRPTRFEYRAIQLPSRTPSVISRTPPAARTASSGYKPFNPRMSSFVKFTGLLATGFFFGAVEFGVAIEMASAMEPQISAVAPQLDLAKTLDPSNPFLKAGPILAGMIGGIFTVGGGFLAGLTTRLIRSAISKP